MRRASIFALIFATAFACSSSEDKPAESDKKAETKSKKSNVKRVTLAVPAGKKIACSDLIPDLAKFREYAAEDIGEMKDRAKSIRAASASCAFVKGGEAPTSDAQLKKLKGENLKLGVLPGDVYCQATLYCSLSTDDGDFKKKCEADAKRESELGSRTIYEGNSSLGQFSCVRKSDRPPSDYSYTYRTIDSDTRCIFEVIGGPSVVSEELVQNCTRAALESIGPQHLKKFL